jgi:hypothetical protein
MPLAVNCVFYKLADGALIMGQAMYRHAYGTILTVFLVCSGEAALGGEGFFEKIGDGWKKGHWIPSLQGVKPQTIQEVIFPICWGHPQDCRDTPTKSIGGLPVPAYSATVRADCQDINTGKPRGDSTVTKVSLVSMEDAKNQAWQACTTTDICKLDPNYQDPTRVEVPGSCRFLDDQLRTMNPTVTMLAWCGKLAREAFPMIPSIGMGGNGMIKSNGDINVGPRTAFQQRCLAGSH